MASLPDLGASRYPGDHGRGGSGRIQPGKRRLSSVLDVLSFLMSPEPIPTRECDAYERLAERLYGELKSIAQRHMRRQPAHASLHPTDLVHEAYLRLVAPDKEWQESRAFLGAAAKAMRSVLVDHARARQRLKREGPGRQVPLDDLCASYSEKAIDLLALDAALGELAAVDEVMARAVELRFFVGLDADGTARALEMPLRTFERRWATTRAWLFLRVK